MPSHSLPVVRLARARGVTLIEVLVALVVLSIGVIGLAALQAQALQMNQGAYMRAQATNLAYDIADRMRTNRRPPWMAPMTRASSHHPIARPRERGPTWQAPT